MTDYNNKIEEIIGKLTLEEKITMIHGAGFFKTGEVERLNIPAFYFSDGPMGVRAEFENDKWLPYGQDDDFVTYLPSNSAIASTWNTEIAYEAGKALGEEARGRSKDMILAPGINIKRDPRCGRNFEYLSEDPRVTERMCVPIIKGIQESDVAACVKHFAVNNQENGRMGVETEVDERTLREIYLPGFKAAILEAGSYSIMGAYNKFRGEQCCESKVLLDEILRDEWKYDGAVVSDWGGILNTEAAANVSIDIDMSVTPDFDDYHFARPLIKAIKEGRVLEEAVNDKVRNVLRLMYRLKMLGNEKDTRKAGAYNTKEHREKAYDVAQESIILLKNEGNLLPLNKSDFKSVAVIGANADIMHSFGGGSAEIKALYEISPLMGIKMALGGNHKVTYKRGYHVASKAMNATESWQAESTNTDVELEYPYIIRSKPGQYAEINKGLFHDAVSAAKEADVVIFVGGLDHNYDIEGKDRDDIKLPYDQDEIIEKLLDVRPDTIIVLNAGSPVEMPWIEKARCVMFSYYAGLEGGLAIADTIFGKINPSGKLSESFPYKLEDVVSYKNGQFGSKEKVSYTEGVFYGYRYYEKENIDVMFPFGFGLSYTEYKYSDFSIRTAGNDKFEIYLSVENIGKYDGKEVVQVYVGENNPTVERPVKELKAFEKITLKKGEKKIVKLELLRTDFAYYDISVKDFVTNNGDYTIYVGPSSQDIKFKETVTI